MYLKVEGHNGYVKDNSTGIVLNVNKEEVQAARDRKAAKQKERDDINNLKNEVNDIKHMLTQIIEKLNG
tara:strand:- start:378 stop:584 length:207 start_codon:yes stop_codon:yes gene_type:complete